MSTGPEHTDVQRGRFARGAISILVTALALAGAACGGTSSTTPTSATATTAVDAAAADAYVASGPYSVGTTTLDLNGRKVEVWYPADDVPPGSQQVVFEIRDLLPDNLKTVVPDDLNPKYPTNAYRDIPASTKGPFPLVLFAHGFAGYPTEYQYLLTHLASWGMVVAGPDFHERGLLAALTGATTTVDETRVMLDTRDLLSDQSHSPGSLLDGVVDASDVATMGHSAGVSSAVGAAAADPSIKTFVAMSGGAALGAASDSGGGADSTESTGTTVPDLPIPTQPGMVVTGGKDQVAPVDRVHAFFDALNTPKRLVVVDDAGHNAFDDLCLIGQDKGGLLAIARQVGIDPPDQIARLFLDGCSPDFLPADQAWPAVRHFVTAQLRFELGLDPQPVGLGEGSGAVFAPTRITYVSVG